ncbi:MAG: hypothetical protein GW875_04545 [Deltaproteobacteria bacterium]|nr:hypothetical protein [Deltaproteobacteria bacterium]NCP02031.1 hypothetical protein [Deltaproteobacteria bacterium]
MDTDNETLLQKKHQMKHYIFLPLSYRFMPPPSPGSPKPRSLVCSTLNGVKNPGPDVTTPDTPVSEKERFQHIRGFIDVTVQYFLWERFSAAKIARQDVSQIPGFQG